MAPPVLDIEDVNGLLVGEDLLGVGHGVHILSGGQYFECRTTRNIWSGVAPTLLLGDEGEAALLVDSDAQHIPAVAFRHLKTHPLKVLGVNESECH